MCVWLVGVPPWCVGVEFVPVDAGAEGGLAGWFVVVLIGGVLGVLVVLFEDPCVWATWVPHCGH